MSENEQNLNAPNLDDLVERSMGSDPVVLLKVKEKLKRRIDKDSDPKDINALNRVNQMLRDSMGKDGNRNFPNLKSVLEYLQKNGRKVSQSQLYKHLNLGHLRRQPDGSFRQKDVDFYATTLKLVAMPETVADEAGDLALERAREDILKIREQRKSIVFTREKEAGKYILREEVALELASRAATLGLGLRSVFRLMVPDWIRMVGGDVNKAADLAAEFEKNLDLALTEYSKPMDFKTEYVQTESDEKKAKPEEDGE